MAIRDWSNLLPGRIILAADAAGGEGLTSFLFPLFLIVPIWYFLIIAPQQRQRKKTQEMLASLKTGDRVLTSGGIFGTIVGFREEVVQLQVASQVKIDVARSAISNLLPAENTAQASGGSETGKREAAAKGKNQN